MRCARQTHYENVPISICMCRLAIYAHSIVITVAAVVRRLRLSCPDVCRSDRIAFFNKLQASLREIRGMFAYVHRFVQASRNREKFLYCHQLVSVVWLWENYAVNLLAHNWVVGIWKFFFHFVNAIRLLQPIPWWFRRQFGFSCGKRMKRLAIGVNTRFICLC